MYSMLVYWGSCLLSIFISNILKIKVKNNLWKIMIASLPIFIITSIRYDVGTDYLSYVRLFHIFQYSDMERFEPLFYILNRGIGFFFNDAQWIFVISAAVFFVFIYLSIFRDSPYPELSIFLIIGTTIFYTYLNGLRQLTGCAICLYSLKYVFKKKPIPFVLLVLIASGLHYSCLLFSIVYLFQYVKLGLVKSIILLIGLFSISQVLANTALEYLANSLYAHYLIGHEAEHFVIFIPINILVWLFCAVFSNKSDPKYNLYLNCQFTMVAVSMFWGMIPFVNRIMWVFWLPQIILLPMSLKGMHSWLLRFFFIIGIVIAFFTYSTYSAVVLESHQVVPYQTIFD